MTRRKCVGLHLSRRALRRGALLTIGAASVAAGIPAATEAATPVVPSSFTSCHGSVKSDPTGKNNDEPNLLDYSFSCDSGITAYSVFVNQQRAGGGAVDDFEGSPSIFETDGLTPSPTESVTCEGVIPSNGINCATGAYGQQITLGYFVQGTIDLVSPYCKHLPTTLANGKPAKPGALATPTATVSLIVSDYTGAEDGPFRLKLNKACPAVPNKVPAEPITTTTKPGKTGPTTNLHKGSHHR
jgi:hypothetical protein